MGTNAAVHLANIYCYYLFDRYFTVHPNMVFYKRYIDDVIGIWSGTREELERHIAWGNSYSETMIWNPEIGLSVNFLDLNISLVGSNLMYRTHQKEMNTYAYLPPFSNHPYASFKGFIKGELIRYLRTNSSEGDFLRMKALFRVRLNQRGFSNRFLDPIFASVLWSHRGRALEDKVVDATPTKAMVVSFSKRSVLNDIGALIRKHEPRLVHDHPARLLLAYKQSNNIDNILCRSRITPPQRAFL
jgi:hypothetical protein